MEQKIFEENIHSYGTVKKGKLVDFTFKLAPGINGDQLDYIWAECGSCTSWKWNESSNSITGTLNTQLVNTNKTGNNIVTKILYVKTNNWVPYFRAKGDGSKERTISTDSGLVRLQITGIVVNDVPAQA